ncbi:hypothetical protein AC249_AIPGENE23018 [Exaiptasia diaphana]|nr:hypothetical protein AC249_AIPGENE23018 [Exaiptasia diaphana]
MLIYDVLWDDIPEEELSNVLEATEASDNCNSCNKNLGCSESTRKAGNHSATRRGFLRFSRALPTSRVF